MPKQKSPERMSKRMRAVIASLAILAGSMPLVGGNRPSGRPKENESVAAIAADESMVRNTQITKPSGNPT